MWDMSSWICFLKKETPIEMVIIPGFWPCKHGDSECHRWPSIHGALHPLPSFSPDMTPWPPTADMMITTSFGFLPPALPGSGQLVSCPCLFAL